MIEKNLSKPSGAVASLKNAARRDDVAFDDLYRSLFRPLCAAIAKAFGRGPPEPEEVAQTAFAKFVVARSMRTISNPRAWLFTVSRNIVLDHKRHKKHVDAYVSHQLAFDSEFELEEITPLRVLEEKQRFEIMVSTLKTLPSKQRTLLIMNRVQGKTYQEIIDLTGWSLGDISRNLNAGKKALLEAIEAAEHQ